MYYFFVESNHNLFKGDETDFILFFLDLQTLCGKLFKLNTLVILVIFYFIL